VKKGRRIMRHFRGNALYLGKLDKLLFPRLHHFWRLETDFGKF